MDDNHREQISDWAATGVAIVLAVAICLGVGGFYFARNLLISRLLTNHAIQAAPPQSTAAAPAANLRR
jgi:hypothetical protein